MEISFGSMVYSIGDDKQAVGYIDLNSRRETYNSDIGLRIITTQMVEGSRGNAQGEYVEEEKESIIPRRKPSCKEQREILKNRKWTEK